MGDTKENRETLLMIEEAQKGNESAKIILAGMAEKSHHEKNPEYYKHVYNPGYSGLRDVHRNDVIKSFIDGEKTRINGELDAMRTSSSSNSQPVVVGEKTPRSISPDRYKRERMKEGLRDRIDRENERIRYANSFLGRMRSRIGNFLKPKDDKKYLSIKEKRKEALRQNGPTARLAKLEEKSLTSRTNGGKKTHKNKKTSKRRRTSRK